jgi:hypothetical protein
MRCSVSGVYMPDFSLPNLSTRGRATRNATQPGRLRRTAAVRKGLRAAIEAQLNSWDEYKGTNSDSAGERDDEARVSDGKSQQPSNEKHRPSYLP